MIAARGVCPECNGYGCVMTQPHEELEACPKCGTNKWVPLEEGAKCERCQVRAADPCFSTPGNPRCGKCEL